MNADQFVGVGKMLGGFAIAAAVLEWASVRHCNFVGALGAAFVCWASLMALLGVAAAAGSSHAVNPWPQWLGWIVGLGVLAAWISGVAHFLPRVAGSLGCYVEF